LGLKSPGDVSCSGLTSAAHDSHYAQAAPSRLTAAGYVEGAACGADGRRSGGGIGYLLRLHPPQDGKLAVEVTTCDRAPKSLSDTVDALKYIRARGYLTR
jgi:hypothetical protein